MSTLEKAKRLLAEGDYTCVFCKDETVLTSRRRGVAPLLDLLDEGGGVKGFSAADKVVGKGAAFLYVLLGVKELYAAVISAGALDVLKGYGVFVKYGILTDAIRNRDNTGFCPIETAVQSAASPVQALAAIRCRLEEMKRQGL